MKTGELPIKSPCDVDWTTMNPRKTGRCCGDCKKVVHDLSSMREADAMKRVAEAPEGLCVRYLHDEHGNIWFRDTSSLLSPGSLLRNSASLPAPALMPMLTACMGAMAAEPDSTSAQPSIPTPPPVVPIEPDAGSDARTSAEPVVGSDASPD